MRLKKFIEKIKKEFPEENLYTLERKGHRFDDFERDFICKSTIFDNYNFIDLLDIICPNITYVQMSKVRRFLMSEDERSFLDDSLEDLYNALVKFGVI